MNRVINQTLIILIFYIYITVSFGQDCDEGMLFFDCIGTGFCNNEPAYPENGFDCYVNNEVCEDFNGDGVIIDSNGYYGAIGSWYNFNYDGQIREYYLYKSDLVIESTSLLIVMHGYSGSASSVLNYSNFNTIAEENGFVVAYPNGTRDQWNNRFWNVGYAFHHNQTVDDVGS